MGDFFSIARVVEYMPQILSRLHITLIIVLLATIAGLILGALLAIIRINKTPVLNQIVLVFVSFIRGTPIVIQLFIVFFGLPVVLKYVGIDVSRWDKLFFVNVTYSINTSAFMSEIIRGAVMGVDVGQKEAAYSVGLTGWQTFKRIIAPQALLIAMPSFSSSILHLLQNTSLGFTIGLVDIIGKVKTIGIRTHHVMEGYVAAAIIFMLLSIILHRIFNLIEVKLKSKILKVGR